MIKEVHKNFNFEEILEEIDYCEYPEQLGVFDNFYKPFLHYFKKQIHKLFSFIRQYEIDKSSVEKTLIQEVKNNMIHICLRTLITYFHEHSQNISYDSFNRSLSHPGQIREILRKYPGLVELILPRLRNTYILISEILYRADMDIHEIRNTFGKECCCLKEIKFSLGDTHNNGKSVAVLCFDSGEKIIYKPRPLSTEIAFESICHWLNKSKNFYTLKTVSSIHKTEYGWQDFVNRKSDLEKEEVIRYCRRIGYFLAIFRVLNTTDIHAENILPMGEYPMLIDLETITANKVKRKDSISLSDTVQELLFYSVISTGLLPVNSISSPLDLDLSGLGGREGQKSAKLKYCQLEDAGTDNIRFEEKYVESLSYDNQIQFQGKRVRFSEYVTDIEMGFGEVYDYIMGRKKDFQTMIDHTLKQARIRQVLRGTFVYERYLSAVYHPKYLKKKEERIRLFNLMNKHNNDKEKQEVKQMLNHDFPYFISNYDDRNLYTADGLCAIEYFEKTVKEIIIQNINRLGTQDRQCQLYLIRNSLMIGKEDIMKGNSSDREQIPVKGNTILEAVEGFADYMIDFSIWNKDKTSCTFLDIRLSESKAAIANMEYNLYQLGGLVIFLYSLSKETKKEKYRYFADAVLKGMEEFCPMENLKVNTSAFSGFSSLLYLYYNIFQLTGDIKYRDKYFKNLVRLQNYEGYSEESQDDIIGGLAGCIVMLCHIYEKEQDPVLLELIIKYTECLKRKCIHKSPKLTGFSHGCSGYAYALSLAGKITGHKSFLEAALEMLEYEDRDFISAEGNWRDKRSFGDECCCYWCHGAPGILLARTLISESIDDSRFKKYLSDKISIALKTTLNSIQSLHNHSLCHGQIGNLEILLNMSGISKSQNLLDKITPIYCDVLADMKKHGIRYGIPGIKGLFSFMQGLSGIAYGFLRSINPSYPSILSLEIYGGDRDEA